MFKYCFDSGNKMDEKDNIISSKNKAGTNGSDIVYIEWTFSCLKSKCLMYTIS